MTSIPENTTLYPQWEAKHVLRYDMNGGDGQYEDSDLPADVSDTAPTRDGYEFDGWMIDGVKVDSDNTVEDNGSDVTVVAQWTPIKQDVTPIKPDVTPTKPDTSSKDDSKPDTPKDDGNTSTPSKDDSKPDTPKDDNTTVPNKPDTPKDDNTTVPNKPDTPKDDTDTPSKDDGKTDEGTGIPSDGKTNEGSGIPSDGKTDVNTPNEGKKPADTGDNKTTDVKKSVQLAQQNEHGLASTGATVTIAIAALVILVAAGATLFVAKRRHE